MPIRPNDFIPLTGDQDYEVVTGHITQADFSAVVAFECGQIFADDLEPARHAYGAKLQTATARDEGWSFEFRLYTERGRGRFPVTIAYKRGSRDHRAGVPLIPDPPPLVPEAWSLGGEHPAPTLAP